MNTTTATTTVNIEKLKRYLEKDLITDKQAETIIDLLNRNYNFGINPETMKKLGYQNFDWAKPQHYMDKLREMGVPNEMLQFTVFDYSKERHGELSNVAIRHYKHIIKTLSE